MLSGGRQGTPQMLCGHVWFCPLKQPNVHTKIGQYQQLDWHGMKNEDASCVYSHTVNMFTRLQTLFIQLAGGRTAWQR